MKTMFRTLAFRSSAARRRRAAQQRLRPGQRPSTPPRMTSPRPATGTTSARSVSLADTLRYANYEYRLTKARCRISARPRRRAGTPLADILVGRDAPASSGVRPTWTEQLDLTARFSTGRIAHTLVSGLEIARQGSDLDRYANPFNANNNWIAADAAAGPESRSRRVPRCAGFLAAAHHGALRVPST